MTEGPWENNGNAVHKRISPHYAECIAICEGPNRRENAAAIAALPELLAAAKTVLAGLNARIDVATASRKPVFNGIADLHAAICKAEGNTL